MIRGNGVKRIEHTGFPYYFTMWNINELYGEWQETNWVTQDPKGMNKTFMTDWDRIYYLDWNFNMWNEPNDKPWIPKMVDRGAIRNRSDIYRLFTAHYPQGYLYPPPDKEPTLVRAPMVVPALKSPAKVILYPKIRKVSLKIDLEILKPPKYYCSIMGNTPQYNGLYYTTPIKTGRKPLQFLVLGTVLAGAIMGG